MYGTTSIPVPDTSVSSVRHPYRYREHRYRIEHTLRISPRLTRERFVKAPPCHTQETTSESRPRPTPVPRPRQARHHQRSDFHIGVDDDILYTLSDIKSVFSTYRHQQNTQRSSRLYILEIKKYVVTNCCKQRHQNQLQLIANEPRKSNETPAYRVPSTYE